MNELSVKILHPIFMLETHQHTSGQPKSFEYSNKEPGVTLIICVYIEILGGFLVKSFLFQNMRPLVAFNMFTLLGPRLFLKIKICWNDDIPEFTTTLPCYG